MILILLNELKLFESFMYL